MIESHGFRSKFRQRLMRMYSNAVSSIQVNGHISSAITIKCTVRQGCPLSMPLFTCLNPLLCMIDENLAATHSGPHNKRTAVIAYADDVTTILRSPKDIPIVQEALRCYEDASGAKLDTEKSKAMALGSWDTSHTILGIPYHTELRILSIKMATTIHQTAINIWRTVIDKIITQARDAYSRTLSLDQRVLYVHNYLLAKAWYTAQILPLPID